MKLINIILLFAFLITSCAPAVISTQSAIPTSTLTTVTAATSIPAATYTPVPTPTPLGGGQLLVAFYAFDDCGECLIIGNFLTGEVLLELPVSKRGAAIFPQRGQIFWSPDGKNILYTIINADKMSVMLANLERKETKKLGDFPAMGGTPEHINSLYFVQWSYDGEYVIYSPRLNKTSLIESYFASKDGVVNSYESRLSAWFPDSRTIFSPYGGTDSYNVETQSFNPVSTKVLGNLKASFVTQKFILLNKDKTKVLAIPFPKNWSDPLAWQFDTLAKQTLTLAELSPDIKNAEVMVGSIEQFDDKTLSLIGYVNISNNLSSFVKLIDLDSLPVEITPNDLMKPYGDTPILVSPDGNYYVLGSCKFTELCPAFDTNWKNQISWGWEFKIMDFNGTVQSIPADLSQFAGVTKIIGGVEKRGDGYLTSGIAFYWK